MVYYVDSSSLKVKCNIQINQVRHLSISEAIGNHAFAELSADIESDSLELSKQEVNGQPIKLYSVKKNEESLIFFGVIGKISIEKQSFYDIVHIIAYSVSWFMDLEQKSRSFQGMVGQQVSKLLQQIIAENNFTLIISGADKVNQIPFIQYQETDWEFLLRLASHLHLHVLAANDYDGRGIYIGFKENSSPVKLEASREIWKMDAENINNSNWKSKAGTYFEVTTGQIFHLGQAVLYKGKKLWIYKVSMVLKQGVLQCVYQLAEKEHRIFSTFYNPKLRGISLTGIVLEQSRETIKVHLDIDGKQDIKEAFSYLWLPEHGNVVYCMPEIGSKIRLLIPGEDEKNAIGIHCIRQNVQNCKETLNPDIRWFITDEVKKMDLHPSFIKITADKETSNIVLQDGVGNIINSNHAILIQANGKLRVQGIKVKLEALKEVTMLKRQLGSPTIVNLCYNLDSLGRYSTFKNLKNPNIQMMPSKGNRTASSKVVMSNLNKEKNEKEKKKQRFELKELIENSNIETNYELGNSVMNVISAIPQIIEDNKVSQFAMGARTITGRMKKR